MKRYPAYKESDVEWIGVMPKHWKIEPAYRAFCHQKEINKGLINNNVLSLSYGKIIKRDVENNFGLLPQSFDTYQLVYPGNIILRLTDLQNDKRSLRVGLVQEEGIITSAYLCLKIANNNAWFCYYLLHSYDTKKVFYNIGGGVRQTMRFDELRQLPIVSPLEDEQFAIVKYLDHKIHLIDTLIEKKQKQIKLLQEQRTAIINHAVTKGLNPNVKMKDTGIEWLGEVPEHWEVMRFKQILRRQKGAIKTGPFGSQLKGNDFVEAGIKVYNQRTVLDNDFTAGEHFISEEKYVSLKGFETFPGDILITSRGTIGRCAIVPEDAKVGVLHPCLIRLQIDNEIMSNEYLRWFIQDSENFRQSVVFESNATTIEVIYGETLKNVKIPVPPRVEQEEILAFLDKMTNTIESSLKNTQKVINALHEYRTTLISDVVTGKIDVRDEVIP